MRGFPPLHLLVFVIGFALFAIPLARLTFARPGTTPQSHAQTAPTVASATTSCIIRVRFAHKPATLSLKLGDKEIITNLTPQTLSPIEAQAAMIIPKDGLELMLNATWPQGTPDTALTVELEPDGLDVRSATRWSNGAKLSEVLSFTW